MRTQFGWALHNLIGHPLSEVAWWLGYLYRPARQWGNWIHDATIPAHQPGSGRG